jgi:uncharacterized protein YggU (UPF0235/DUF167 family)|nr:MAG: hypothetical protein GM42_3970 [actinobacterium acMicro-1]
MSGEKITVHVKPGSARGPLVEEADDHFVVYVKEKAIDGKANQGVIKAMSEHLGIAPSRLVVVGGAAARIKRIEIRPA